MKTISDYEMYKIMIKNDLDGTIDRIIEKNNQLTRQDVKIEELEEENERLNNIINELNEYLDLKRKSYIEGFKWSGLEIIDQTKDFLQELKGSDKE